MERTDWQSLRHFERREWAKFPDLIHPAVVYGLDGTREATLGVPVHVHVAADDSGHSERSFHYALPDLGRDMALAVDFHFGQSGERWLSYSEQFRLLQVQGIWRGIGFYPLWERPGWHADMGERGHDEPVYWVRVSGGQYLYSHNAWQYLIPRLRIMDRLFVCCGPDEATDIIKQRVREGMA